MRQNRSTDFFTVVPASGEFRAGETAEFQVTVHPEKLAEAKLHSGAFLISTPDGLSRPVTVRADLRDDPERVAQARRGVIYGTVSPQDAEGNCTFEFDVKKPGEYYLFGFTSKMPYAAAIRRSGAETEFRRFGFYGILGPDRPLWCAMSPEMYSMRIHLPQKFSAGRHRFEVKRYRDFDYRFDAVALAETPEALLDSPFVR